MKSALLAVAALAIAFCAAPLASRAASISVGISVGIAPPPIPVYTQPPCPEPGYIWTPGYWAYDPDQGYFWIPGTWVMAPEPGLLWTPGYWGWSGAAFLFHAGYWGPHVGFYGGVNYGFGYPGAGFVGGEWRGRNFFYNRSVNNFGGAHITNVYYRPVTNNFAVNRVSYNGGRGGIGARPSPGEMAAARDRHIEATSLQRDHEVRAHNERAQFASVNHGRPEVAATGRPGEFHGGTAHPQRPGNSGPNHWESAGHGNNNFGSHGSNPPGGNHEAMPPHQNGPAAHGGGEHSGGPGINPAHHEPAHEGGSVGHGNSNFGGHGSNPPGGNHQPMSPHQNGPAAHNGGEHTAGPGANQAHHEAPHGGGHGNEHEQAQHH